MIGRLGAVVGSLLVGAGVVVLAALTPPQEPLSPAVESFKVLPATYPLACPGVLVLPVGHTEDSGTGIGSGSSDETFSVLPTRPAAAPVGEGLAIASPVAATVERIGGGDLAGLAAAACAQPQLETWLVGGSTVPGNSARLVLTNSADAATDISVTAFTETGVHERLVVVTVPARSSRSVLMEGILPDAEALVIKVDATGPGVVASVQDSRLGGFQPYGTDWVTSAPLDRVLGVPIAGPSGADTDSAAVLRLLAPEGASVDLRLANPGGEVRWPGAQDLVLDPGVVLDIPVPAGDAAGIVVYADKPVVASVMVRTSRIPAEGIEGDLAYDLAWSVGEPLDEELPQSVVVPEGVVSVAVIAADDGEFVLRDDEGEVVARANVSAYTAVRIPLSVAPGTVVEANGPFAWAVLITGDPSYIAVVEPRITANQAREIRVQPLPEG